MGGKLLGLAGFRPSGLNPNLCRVCFDAMPPGGAEIELAVLFADLRGSTSLAEPLPPEDYARLLAAFYRAATRVLLRHDAIIDKLIGDEVMALFVPGVAGPAYRERAVDAALGLLAAVRDLPASTPLPVGIGVHAGPAFVGNLGAEGVFDFTAVGDTVNTAARLQGLAAAGEAIVSVDIYAASDPPPGAETRTVEVRGREGPIEVHVLHAPA